MTDPLDLFDQAVAERPAAAAPTEQDRARCRAAVLDQLEAMRRPAPSPWPRQTAPLLLAAAAAAALLIAWLVWPHTPAAGLRPDRAAPPMAGGPGLQQPQVTPIWTVVHDDPARLAAWRAAPAAATVAATVVRENLPLDRFRIDDQQLDGWLQSVGLRPARVQVGERIEVLDLLSE